MWGDDVEALNRAIAEGRTPEYLFFWGHTSKGPLGKECLSQWYPAAFTHEGRTYTTAEHWMMAGKARVFGDDAALDRVFAAASPADAKKIGREVRNFDPDVWDRERYAVVIEGNVLKFGQNAALGEFLQATGDQVLVEASPRDRIWGIGMGASNPAAQDPTQWRGLNLLGFALMRARERLRAA